MSPRFHARWLYPRRYPLLVLLLHEERASCSLGMVLGLELHVTFYWSLPRDGNPQTSWCERSGWVALPIPHRGCSYGSRRPLVFRAHASRTYTDKSLVAPEGLVHRGVRPHSLFNTLAAYLYCTEKRRSWSTGKVHSGTSILYLH